MLSDRNLNKCEAVSWNFWKEKQIAFFKIRLLLLFRAMDFEDFNEVSHLVIAFLT